MLLFVFLMRRAAGAGAGGLMSFGRVRARRAENSDQEVTFADVAGIDEANEELNEIVDFLKNGSRPAGSTSASARRTSPTHSSGSCPIAVLPSDASGPFFPGVRETSEATQQLVDEEIKRIVESAHTEVSEMLRAHRANLDSLASALLEHETLDEADAYEAAGLPRNQLARPEPVPPAVG